MQVNLSGLRFAHMRTGNSQSFKMALTLVVEPHCNFKWLLNKLILSEDYLFFLSFVRTAFWKLLSILFYQEIGDLTCSKHYIILMIYLG